MPGGFDDALLAIDTTSGEILDGNEAAASLLGITLTALRAMSWQRALACDAACGAILSQAIGSGRRLALPPILVCRQDAREMILGGLLAPSTTDHSSVCKLWLWPLLDETSPGISAVSSPADTLAVLGVDQLRYDDRWSAADTARLMADICASLQSIVRKVDVVGAPSAATVPVLLRNTRIEESGDICLALLSHLRREYGPSTFQKRGMRICFGLAHRTPANSGLSTLWAASNSLLLAQSSGASEAIRVAEDNDHALIVGLMLNSAGVFNAADTVASPPVEETTAVPATPLPRKEPPVAPIERNIEGYVVDNMEGAVDQAIFLAQLDIPIAIIGPAGTGKMYIAQIIHEESGGDRDMLVTIDCREFHSRKAAQTRIARELAQGEGKTLVFKSPHLMHAEVQQKLARQISSRTLADVSPPRYLPRMKLIALFPERLEVLTRRGELWEPLASAFAGYPINVPPISDRKQAVLRWAHKILGQEGVLRDRDMKGFTPDAEQALLQYDWPGNISEMRRCIQDALDKTDKNWLTPVDLGLFRGINPEGLPFQPEPKPFLTAPQVLDSEEETYAPSALEAVHTALGEAVHSLLELNLVKPLGVWVHDELVLAALDRYRGDLQRTGEFLHTRPRNISRWLPGIRSREEERNGSSLWQQPRRLLREWVREAPQSEESPLSLMGDKLMSHVIAQGGALSSANRARIVGVSVPTYLKRLREVQKS